jgi:hypothetical protein
VSIAKAEQGAFLKISHTVAAFCCMVLTVASEEPAKAMVFIRAADSADIRIDSLEIGKKDSMQYLVSAGKHRIIGSLPGWISDYEDIELAPGSIDTVNISPKRFKACISPRLYGYAGPRIHGYGIELALGVRSLHQRLLVAPLFASANGFDDANLVTANCFGLALKYNYLFQWEHFGVGAGLRTGFAHYWPDQEYTDINGFKIDFDITTWSWGPELSLETGGRHFRIILGASPQFSDIFIVVLDLGVAITF